MSVCSTVERVIDPARQGISHEPESHVEKMHPPVPLEEAMAVIETWAPGYQPFRGFAISRALYQEVLRLRDAVEDLEADSANDYGQAQSYERAIHALCDVIGIERGTTNWSEWIEMVGARMARQRAAAELSDERADIIKTLQGFCDMTVGETDRRAQRRALAAVPCSAGLADCHAPYYRHFHCCNLRVALWPGEEFPTDYLPDEGFIHLFEPGREAWQVRKSAGCVRLIEPTARSGAVVTAEECV